MFCHVDSKFCAYREIYRIKHVNLFYCGSYLFNHRKELSEKVQSLGMVWGEWGEQSACLPLFVCKIGSHTLYLHIPWNFSVISHSYEKVVVMGKYQKENSCFHVTLDISL